MWSGINEILNTKRKKGYNDMQLLIKDKSITDKKEAGKTFQ